LPHLAAVTAAAAGAVAVAGTAGAGRQQGTLPIVAVPVHPRLVAGLLLLCCSTSRQACRHLAGRCGPCGVQSFQGSCGAAAAAGLTGCAAVASLELLTCSSCQDVQCILYQHPGNCHSFVLYESGCTAPWELLGHTVGTVRGVEGPAESPGTCCCWSLSLTSHVCVCVARF
jgi:hypothetical protein